jgi:epoxyqueuosine reductase
MSTSSVPEDNLEKLRAAAEGTGIDCLAAALIEGRSRKSFHESIHEETAELTGAVVIGIRLSEPVLETVKTAPTWTYYHHYRMVNIALDQAALRIAGECQRLGHRAFPVPASQIVDWEKLVGHLSHSEMGALAGLGWHGRNNLLVHPEYGSRVRYATVLTDLPLPGGSNLRADCGDCFGCISACPVGAIHEDPMDFDLDKCRAQLRRFARDEKLNTQICGLCVRACAGRRR